MKQEMEWQIKRESRQPPVQLSLATAETAGLAAGLAVLGHLSESAGSLREVAVRTERGARGPVVFAHFQ